MKNKAARKIEARLKAFDAPEPPAELLETLKNEIPEGLGVAREAEADEMAPFRRRPALRLVAASLLVAVVGAVVAYRVMERSGRSLEETLWESAAADLEIEEPEERAGDAVVVLEAGRGSSLEEAAPVEPKVDRDQAAEVAALEGRALVPQGAETEVEIAALETVGPPEAVRQQPVTAPEPLGRVEREEDLAEPVPVTADALGANAGGGRETPGAEASPKRKKVRATHAQPAPQPFPVEPRRRDPAELGVSAWEMEDRAVAPPSTGGTDEPNDQPYGDMFFRSYGVNPFVDTEDDRFSTFGLDVDTGSYTLGRSYLQRGHLPPPESVRVEEYLNYFDYGDRAPRRGDFGLTVEGAPSPFAEGPRYQLIRFGLVARESDRLERRPADLVFVVDVSGSMEREKRLGLVRDSLDLLLDELEEGDRVALVVYGSRGEVLLEPTGDHEAIRDAIGRLRPGGSTNVEEGLILAYELARRHHRSGAIHRIILCSDGVANVGRTGADSILLRVADEAARGIELTTVGFGMGNYNDVLMEQLADKGDGSYAYVDNLDEARRIFVENLTGTLSTVARDAKVQVEFDPAVVSRYRLLGYENRDVADERFRDDTVDAGEVGAGHRVTALYEVKLTEDAPRRARLATFRLRYRSAVTGRVEEFSREVGQGDLARSWSMAPSSLRLSALVAEFAEILKGSYWAREGDLVDLFRGAQELSAELPGEAEVAELAALIGRAADLLESGTGPER